MYVLSILLLLLFAVMLVLAFIKRHSLENMLYYFAGYFIGSDIQSNIALETVADPVTVITRDGDLVTFLRVRGSSRLIGRDDFSAKAERLTAAFRLMLADGTGRQHGLSVGYLSDPPGTGNVIGELMKPSLATAARMGAHKNADIWFAERRRFLSRLCNDENVILAIHTFRSGLNQKEAERYREWRNEIRQEVSKVSKNVNYARGENNRFGQPYEAVYPLLMSRHKAVIESFVETVSNEAGGIAIMVDTLKCDHALYYLRRFIDGTQVPPNWRPTLIGKHAPVATKMERSDDLANAQPVAIARQLITAPTVEHFESMETVEREGVWYASLKMDVCPNEIPNPAFSDLVDKIGVRFPFNVSFEISPNGMDFKKSDQMFSAFFGAFGGYNQSIKTAWDELKQMEDEYIAAIRVVCTTWANTQQDASDQAASIKMALQGWGGSTVSNESGAPSSLLLASAPALSQFNPAPFLPGPLSTFSRMMPIFRPASPWDYGQLILRTRQGKPYPVAFGSTIQAFWGTIVCAPPGRGKSFLMNCLNSGMLFSPGLSNLPFITIIDKGMSSANVVEMARGILPEDRRHEAISIRLRNNEEYSINAFDTQLGMDMPTERERDFQINIVSAMCPNLGPEGTRYIGQVVDQAYKMLSRESMDAKRWQRALDLNITNLLEHAGIEVSNDSSPRIWEVVDALFDMGKVHEAVNAQRFAVPILDDLIKASYHESVQDLYSNTPTPTNEKITEVFNRSITTASREYALLSGYTRFSVGDARVISVDLEEVLANSSSEEARRRAAIMILFARQIGAKNYFLKWDEISNLVPARYQSYQFNRINVLSETLKFLQYDEFHNAHGMVDVQRMVETDFREGRKYNVVPLLSSQMFQDFTPELINNASNFFILGVGSAEESRKVQETFDLTEAERRTILHDCLGPTSKGAPLFGMFKTNRGIVSQLLFNSASTMEQWAFNSSQLDVSVRQNVVKALKNDYWMSLKGLSAVFPDGTARHAIEDERLNMDSSDEADDAGITSTVARKAVDKIHRLMAQEERSRLEEMNR